MFCLFRKMFVKVVLLRKWAFQKAHRYLLSVAYSAKCSQKLGFDERGLSRKPTATYYLLLILQNVCKLKNLPAEKG